MKNLNISDNPIKDITALSELRLESLTYSKKQATGKQNLAVIKKLARRVDELDPPLSELKNH